MTGSAKPREGRCGARLRGKDAGRFCADGLVKGRTRCRLHGGATPREAARNSTRHGAYAKAKVAPALFEAPFVESEARLIDRWRRDPEEALRLQLAEGAVVQRRALRAGAVEIYTRLGTMIATTARALVSLREVPQAERGLPKVVEVFEGKTAEDYERDLEVIRRDAAAGALAIR